jgi:hypothetical protein
MTRTTRRGFLAQAAMGGALFSQEPPRSYDESKVRPYTLPDPLVFNDGRKVKNRADWEKRRAELLRLFEENVYGSSPGAMKDASISAAAVDPDALNGKAVRKMITIRFRRRAEIRTLDLLMYLPKQRPAPVFVGVNFRGNHTVTNDPDIPISTKWVYSSARMAPNNRSTEASRGMQANQWPIEQIIDGGYGVATFYSGDLSPDFNEGFAEGIEPLFYRPGQSRRDPGEWGAIGAWAWGLSRAMDYFETDPDVDPRRVAVMGHSRMGKTALWAGGPGHAIRHGGFELLRRGRGDHRAAQIRGIGQGSGDAFPVVVLRKLRKVFGQRGRDAGGSA